VRTRRRFRRQIERLKALGHAREMRFRLLAGLPVDRKRRSGQTEKDRERHD
jgi:hypothetical protein